jgi:hypothetical protein
MYVEGYLSSIIVLPVTILSLKAQNPLRTNVNGYNNTRIHKYYPVRP